MKLTAGDAVMLGSLDRTARRHHVTLTWIPAGVHGTAQTVSDQSVVVRKPVVDGRTARRLQICPPSRGGLSVSEMSIERFESTTSEISGSIAAVGRLFAKSDGAGNAEAMKNSRLSSLSWPAGAEGGSRRFAVPLFTAGGVHDHQLLMHQITRGDRVRVYGVSLTKATVSLAEAVVDRLERRLVRFVEARVGALADTDCDGSLTVVLSKLETREQFLTGNEPVRGCVRAADILAPGDFGGDIIYLSETLRVDDELDAILAHELTHLAVFSRLCTTTERTPLPRWLNEALAHYVECQVNPSSRNMATRLEEFRRHPADFPVIVPDQHVSLSLRRGPARAAGCLFLSSALSRLPEHAVHDIVAGAGGAVQRLEQVTGRSFGELFREWGLNMIAADSHLPRWDVVDGQTLIQTLTGTAQSWSTPVSSDGMLAIKSSRDCRLQVTVLNGGLFRLAYWIPDGCYRR
ncbi:MAG: hypothetical protein GY758_26140 [Fuerstiella sp.]|nr:hypothetical protein [Fuerstiella sp.]